MENEMPKNRQPQKLTADELKQVEEAASDYPNEYVLHSGDTYRARRTSARNLVIKAVSDQSGEPISMADWLTKAANVAGKDTGLPVGFCLSALSLHAGAKPAVMIRMYKDAEGNFRSSTTVPTPGQGFGTDGKIIEADDIVIAAKATKKAPSKRAAKK